MYKCFLTLKKITIDINKKVRIFQYIAFLIVYIMDSTACHGDTQY